MLDAVYDAVEAMMARPRELTEGLVEVVALIARSLTRADGAGVALMQGSEVLVRVASSTLVDKADAVQYGLGEGPCLSAVAEGRAIRTGSLTEHLTRWPRFATIVQRLGIGSMLSLPLLVQTEVIGSINIYAVRGDGFSQLDAESGERLALPVAAAIRSAQATRNVDHLEVQMHETLASKAAVTAAVAMLAERDQVARDAALQSLSRLAGERHESLLDTAAAVLRSSPEATPSDETGDDASRSDERG